MMKLFKRMTSMYLSFTQVVHLNPVVSLLLNLAISTFQLINKSEIKKNGRILILDVNIDEIRYVLINIYNANAKVEQVQVLRIFTGKKHPQMKLQHLQKQQVWAFGLSVQQINYL